MPTSRDSARDPSHAVTWLAALLLPVAACAIALALDGRMSVAGLSMVFLAAVLAAAAMLPRAPATLSALLAVTALNVLFVPPRGSISVEGAESLWILAALLSVSLGVGALVRRLRARSEEAEEGRRRVCELHGLGEAMARACGYQDMALAAAAFMSQAIGAPCAVFLVAPQGAMERWTRDEAEFQERPARWSMANGKPIGRGCADWPELPLWCGPFARHQASGAVQALLPDSAVPDQSELEHWLALARQAGLAIERERSASAAATAAQSAKAEAARNTLLASLAHDLRTPLASIVGGASALRSQGGELTAAQRERLLANLEDEAQDMALMADNILQLARLSQPDARPRAQWESLEDVLGAAVARMRRRWPGASIQLKAGPALPPIQAEAGLLAQAVANLVDNAARHGGFPPRVIVQAGRSRDGVFVAVRDHGSGFPPGDPSLLFERWRGAAPASSGGSGLGLAICMLAAQAHGGAISARRCDPGAEIRIDLPGADIPQELA